MPKIKGYNTKKADRGLGWGGNPRLNVRPDYLNDSMDSYTVPSDEKTIVLSEKDILSIMREKGDKK
jgi:hypothetical protein